MSNSFIGGTRGTRGHPPTLEARSPFPQVSKQMQNQLFLASFDIFVPSKKHFAPWCPPKKLCMNVYTWACMKNLNARVLVFFRCHAFWLGGEELDSPYIFSYTIDFATQVPRLNVGQETLGYGVLFTCTF